MVLCLESGINVASSIANLTYSTIPCFMPPSHPHSPLPNQVPSLIVPSTVLHKTSETYLGLSVASIPKWQLVLPTHISIESFTAASRIFLFVATPTKARPGWVLGNKPLEPFASHTIRSAIKMTSVDLCLRFILSVWLQSRQHR